MVPGCCGGGTCYCIIWGWACIPPNYEPWPKTGFGWKPAFYGCCYVYIWNGSMGAAAYIGYYACMPMLGTIG